jgi:N-acetylglucosaminyldiphosphoundecaprenol N-acetyl-beta-D-mannosaminyltransferase
MLASESTINILGFPTTTLSREDIVSLVDTWVKERSASRHLMALNPIKVCRARREPDLASHIREADVVYPDAFGIAWAMRVFSGKKYPTIPGCDLMFDVLNLASRNHYKVFLFGSAQPVLERTRDSLLEQYPGLTITGIRNGYFKNDEEKEEAVAEILSCKPEIIFVGMGALIQENWITRIQHAAKTENDIIPVCMGVGGSFDAVTGNVPRPPRWMLDMHLEWLFRLIQQPFRAPRMLALPQFALLVLAKRVLGLNTDYSWNTHKTQTSQVMQKAEA